MLEAILATNSPVELVALGLLGFACLVASLVILGAMYASGGQSSSEGNQEDRP